MAMITHPEQVQRAINSKFAHAPPSRPPQPPTPSHPPLNVGCASLATRLHIQHWEGGRRGAGGAWQLLSLTTD